MSNSVPSSVFLYKPKFAFRVHRRRNLEFAFDMEILVNIDTRHSLHIWGTCTLTSITQRHFTNGIRPLASPCTKVTAESQQHVLHHSDRSVIARIRQMRNHSRQVSHWYLDHTRLHSSASNQRNEFATRITTSLAPSSIQVPLWSVQPRRPPRTNKPHRSPSLSA